MEENGPSAGIIVFLLFLLIDAFFYGFGAAISHLSEKEFERKAEEEHDQKAIRLLKMIDAPYGYINTVQLVATMITMLVGFLYVDGMNLAVQDFLDKVWTGMLGMPQMSAQLSVGLSLAITYFVLLYIILTFGVLLPKRVASRCPDKWAYLCVNPAYGLTKILMPLTGLVAATTYGILYLFGVRKAYDENDVTEEEIISMVQEGHEQGVIQASEAEMISNIFEYGDKEVQDIMTHRNNIIAVDGSTKLMDAIAFMLDSRNSRYPVYEENIDNVIGILHLKDAMRFHIEDDNLDETVAGLPDLLREPYFVPKTKNIDELFKEMQSKKLQMAIVIDEYGQTDGLVAMEDILEEIVGNIMDEYDEEQEYIEDKGNDEYIMEGKTPLEEVEELFHISFEEEEFETLNGFLISRLDKIPEPDEQFDVDYQGYNFKILHVEKMMIQSVLVTKLPEEEPETEEEE